MVQRPNNGCRFSLKMADPLRPVCSTSKELLMPEFSMVLIIFYLEYDLTPQPDETLKNQSTILKTGIVALYPTSNSNCFYPKERNLVGLLVFSLILQHCKTKEPTEVSNMNELKISLAQWSLHQAFQEGNYKQQISQLLPKTITALLL